MQIQTDRAFVPANTRATRYLTITVAAPERERRSTRPATSVALVLDRSGSMAGTKIAMARKAVDHAIQLLDARDELAVVVFDTEVDVVAPRAAASARHKAQAARQLAAIDARGGTDLESGWLKGASFKPNRVLLLTDGLANSGETNPDVLAARAAELRAAGIQTTTFGVGEDFDETLLERLATAGGGHFYYIEHAQQIPDVFASELGEMLDVVAHGACLDITCGPGVTATVLNTLRSDMAAGVLRVELGDLTSGQELTLGVAVHIDEQALAATPYLDCRLSDKDAALYPGVLRVNWTAVSAADDEAQPINADVVMAVAELVAARARGEALVFNRDARFEEAATLLRSAAESIRAIAPGDEGLGQVAAALDCEHVEYSQPLTVQELKTRHFASYSAISSRTAEGRAKRRQPSSL
jgi:Ca-activated chloride channel family protein